MEHNIKVDNIILNNETLSLENQNINKIFVRGNCKLNLFNCNIINLDINLEDNAFLIVNYFS